VVGSSDIPQAAASRHATSQHLGRAMGSIKANHRPVVTNKLGKEGLGGGTARPPQTKRAPALSAGCLPICSALSPFPSSESPSQPKLPDRPDPAPTEPALFLLLGPEPSGAAVCNLRGHRSAIVL
jgi:hypothetical protein